MPPEKLVLLKPKTQRLAEMIVLPTISLAVGPTMRALLGERYSIFYGLLAMFALLMLWSFLSSQWAARHAGEWVTRSERLRRLVADGATASRSASAVMTITMCGLMLFAMILVIDPIDRFGSSIGGAPMALSLIAVTSSLAGSQAVFARRRLG